MLYHQDATLAEDRFVSPSHDPPSTGHDMLATKWRASFVIADGVSADMPRCRPALMVTGQLFRMRAVSGLAQLAGSPEPIILSAEQGRLEIYGIPEGVTVEAFNGGLCRTVVVEAQETGPIPWVPSATTACVAADSRLRALGRLITDHIFSQDPDALFADGLGMAMVACASAPQRLEAGARRQEMTDRRIARALDYINAHFSDPICTASIAEAANLSAGHFSRLFKTVVGKPVWSYVMQHRCEQARELLLTTTLPIAEITYRCGFAHQGHLTSRFRQLYGTTPGALRRNG